MISWRRCGVLIGALTIYCAPAPAADGQFYGLLRSRDLTPFGALRLDMRPAHALNIATGTWALEVEIGYQNTWALSSETEKYLETLEPSGRRHLGPAEAQAIRDLPGENYLLDLESTAIDINWHYKFADHWSVYAIVSAMTFQGGFLDDTIESFHRSAHYDSFGRHATGRNEVNLIYDLKTAQSETFQASPSGGLTDPTIGVRYAGFDLPGRWDASVELAVKLPITGRREFLSTGRLDVGTQGSLRWLGKRNGFFLDVAAVYYQGTPEPAPQDSQIIPTAVLGWELQLSQHTHFNLQAYASSSVYSHKETDLVELLGTKYQASIGIRHRADPFIFSFAITENLFHFNNTPDVGFQTGFAFVPTLRHRPR
jgi:hypothetical protein